MKIPARIFMGIFLLAVSMVFAPMAISAQTEDAAVPRPIYILNNNQILRWDVDTGERMPVISLGTHFVGANAAQQNTQNVSLRQVVIDTGGHYAFHIDSTGEDDRQRIIYTRLVRTDFRANVETILLEHTGIMQFLLSSLADKVYVLYYEGAIERSPLIACLLTSASETCQALPITPSTSGYPLWVDDQTLVTLVLGKVTVIDVSTLQITVLNTPDNFFIDSFALIPNTRQFILGVNRYDAQPGTPIEFYSLDRDTQELKPFSWGTIFDPRTIDGYTVTTWLFSSDNHYLLYGNMGLYTKVAVVDFQSGRAIKEIDEVTQALWLDNRHLLFTRWSAKPVPLVELDAVTGDETILIPDISGMSIIS